MISKTRRQNRLEKDCIYQGKVHIGPEGKRRRLGLQESIVGEVSVCKGRLGRKESINNK